MRVLFFIAFLGLISCSKKSESVSKIEVKAEEASLSFSLDSLVQNKCEGEDCASLRLVWPMAKGSEIADPINQAVQEHVNSMLLFGDVVSTNRDTLVMDYFQSFTEFKSDFPDGPGAWEIDVEGSKTYQSDSTISLQFYWMSYMGGAHPNHGQDFLNFNALTGKYLSRDQVVLDEIGLKIIAEKKFREYHEVAEGVSLEDDGRFFLPETGFFLANAMGFKDDKFWIVYVPYEIGPYVMGDTELEFSREETKDFVHW